MTIRELLAAIKAANVSADTEVFGPGGPLNSVHIEDGSLVLDEADAQLVRKLARSSDASVLWPDDRSSPL